MDCTRISILVLATLLTTGCGSMIVSGAATGGYGSSTPSGAVSEADAAITNAINRRFIADGQVRAMAIRVETRERVVTLRGRVASASVRERAAALARGVDGVERVVNQLTLSYD